ncbi:ATP-binding protein [Kribbella sp. DT2]|uniref:ATP-binding protein n=1 Tax=Kribbella sp. DT2 TaxID=3393427 RepID=UPI003CE975B5
MSLDKALQLGSRTIGDSIVVRPRGVLDVATAPRLRTYLLKAVADQPAAVIVTLQDLVLARAFTLSIFTAVARQAADWSGVPMILVIGPGHGSEVQRQSRTIARFLPVHTELAGALAAINSPPARQLTRLRLAPSPHSGGVARRFVSSTCELWRCEDVSEDAVAIASELIGNVVRHAHTDADLRLELRRELLTVAVTDGSALFPVPRPASTTRENGLGLTIVTTLASAWGANPTSAGGKVVWATLRLQGSATTAAIINRRRNGQ